jgi:hypothetical protein
VAVAANLQIQPRGQGVDHRNADTVQSPGNLVGTVVELAAGMQDGHHHLGGGFFLGGVHANGNTAAVVLYRHRTIEMEGN